MPKTPRTVRMEDQDWAALGKVAEHYGMTASSLLVACALQVIREHETNGPVSIIRSFPVK